LYDAAPVAEKEQHMAMLRTHQVKLALWAKLCPQNYGHKLLLVQAEVARVSGHEREAIDLYDQAIDAARAYGFVRDEAMSSELCAKFYLSIGRNRYARAYMADAYHGYLAWGATAKVDDLVSKVPNLLPQTVALPAARKRAPARATSSQTTSTSKLSTNLLDVEAVIRAAQAIAGEVVLENVVQRLMDIIIKNAGAQKGVLILERENRLMVEATITVDPNLVKVGPPIPVEASAELPLTVVQYVARTREPVVLGDAMHEPRFAADPYMASHSPKSILCLAMVHQGRSTGIFYLENKFANDAFTPARLELLKLLLAQAATAVENALLYARLQSRTEALHEAEERLRVEFAERERSEQARVVLQEEIIRVQSDRLAELSTPIIPITDRIMVMPLIGMMDGERAQQVLSTALQGIQRSRAEVVIIDITGVKLVDNEVASTLISTASALRLLGAQAVITGIRPEVAQTLIGLQIDFGSIVTMGTLQSGIAHALKWTG
jgi:GAF domain-containing protein